MLFKHNGLCTAECTAVEGSGGAAEAGQRRLKHLCGSKEEIRADGVIVFALPPSPVLPVLLSLLIPLSIIPSG